MTTHHSPQTNQPIAAPSFLAGDIAVSTEPVTAELAAIQRGIALQEHRAAAKLHREADRLRETLVNQYRSTLINATAAPAARRPELREDFWQAAVTGLLNAERVWSEKSHTGNAAQFGSYIKAYVLFEVLRVSRLSDPVPLTKRGGALAAAVAEVENFYAELGLPTPTDEAIVEQVNGVSPALVHSVRNRPRAVELDLEVHDARSIAISRGGDPLESAMLAELERELPRCIRRLPEREQALVAALVESDGNLAAAARSIEVPRLTAFSWRAYSRYQLAGEPTLEGYLEAA